MWKIHNFFHVSLLEQDITRKKQIGKEVRQIKFDAGDDDSGEYEVEAIWDSTIYMRESESAHLPGFYYQVSQKNIQRNEIPGSQLQRFNTSESLSACSIRTILTSQAQFLLLLTPRYQWLDQQSNKQSSPLSFLNKSKNDQLIALINKQ